MKSAKCVRKRVRGSERGDLSQAEYLLLTRVCSQTENGKDIPEDSEDLVTAKEILAAVEETFKA